MVFYLAFRSSGRWKELRVRQDEGKIIQRTVRDFFNNRADSWDTKIADDPKRVSEGIIRGLGISKGSRVLDVGCGTGLIIPWLLEETGENGHVTALDIAERMLMVAREKYNKPNLEYVHADIASAPFPDGSFDEVICHNCFPHIAYKDIAVRQIFRILKPGGRVTICHNESREAVNELHSLIGQEVGMDMIPDAEELTCMFRSAGFVRVSVCDGDEMFVLEGRKPG